MRLNANDKVQLGVGKNFDNSVNLYFDLERLEFRKFNLAI